jgi:hypothetical protein
MSTRPLQEDLFLLLCLIGLMVSSFYNEDLEDPLGTPRRTPVLLHRSAYGRIAWLLRMFRLPPCGLSWRMGDFAVALVRLVEGSKGRPGFHEMSAGAERKRALILNYHPSL